MLDNNTPADAGEQHRTDNATASDWFHKKVIRSRLGVFSEVVTVTPEIARHLLSVNAGNRRVISSHVARMASDMRDGLWVLNGESIKVSRDGRLCDGQNRLHAVVLADTSIDTVVTFGIDHDTRFTTDQGVAKTVGDYLTMEWDGIANASLCASVSRMLLGYRLGIKTDYLAGGGARKTLTKVRIRKEYKDNQKSIDNAVHFVAGKEVSKALGGKSVIATALVLMRRYSPSAEDFITKYISGADLSEGSPILAARDRMIREPGMRMDDRIKLLLKAFDAWLEDRTVTRFMVKTRKDAGKKRAA